MATHRRPRSRPRGRLAAVLLVVAMTAGLGYVAYGPARLGAARSTGAPDPGTVLAGRPGSGSPVVAPSGQDTGATNAAPVPRVATRLPVPAGSGSGRRIVYSERTMHVWLVDAAGTVVRDFPVIGRRDKPDPGTYRVFSKSRKAFNPEYDVTFQWMVRFATGDRLPIGFHDLPLDAGGRYFDRPEDLGKPIGRGGCAASAPANARFLYQWAPVGTKVVVVR